MGTLRGDFTKENFVRVSVRFFKEPSSKKKKVRKPVAERTIRSPRDERFVDMLRRIKRECLKNKCAGYQLVYAGKVRTSIQWL